MNNKKWFLASLLLLNAVPLYGVLAWGWQSFDLIFLYWLENVIIGVFAILRFLVRPNWQEKEKRRAFFTVPFFVIHYGLFCFAHGTLVMNLFGDSVLGQIAEQSIPTVIPVVLEMRNLWWAVIALAVLQLLDWIRDARQREDGEQVSRSDAVRELMVAPYERIIVMHFALILSALALSNLGEPVVGLVVFVAVKTAFDIRYWRKDEERAKRSPAGEVRGRSKSGGDRTHDSPPQ